MFIITALLNLFSSYLISSVYKNFMIIFVSYFALVVLNIEILSLFGAIKDTNILMLSVLNFVLSFAFFKLKKASLLKFSFDFKRLKNALFLDKSLIVMSVAFLILISITLFLALVMPVLEPDSQTYHFLRAYEFVKNQSLAHFETNDIRALIMPINSEIFYAWMLAFKKNFYGYGILSYCSYFMVIFSLWGIFEEFKFAFRKRLYAIFLFSSLSAIIIQIPSLQTDICVGAFLVCAFYLFIKKNPYFSSLSFALALGIKSTALFSGIGFFVLIMLYEILIEKNKKLTKTKCFSVYLIINFLIFSSYNYFLNLIQFHNPFANRAAFLGHAFWGGIKGYIANLIHFFFQSFDFTGFKWGYYLNYKIIALKDQIFDFINISPHIGCNIKQEKVNIITDEQTVGFGILGFLVFLPTIFISLFKIFFNKNKKTILIFLMALVFLINIFVLARAMAYMVFSIRFVVAFVCLSSVVLVNVYCKKSFIKPIIFFFCLFYMILIPSHIRRMPLNVVLNNMQKNNFDKEKFSLDCFNGKVISTLEIAPKIYSTIKTKYEDKRNIAFVKSLTTSALFLKKLEYEGYKMDFLNPGLINSNRLKQYDLVILEDNVQNDNAFNPENIEIKYKTKGDSIVFNSNHELNCFYIYKQGNKLEDALERTCFTLPYLDQNKDFKKDYVQTIKIKELAKDMKIYYFINQIKD